MEAPISMLMKMLQSTTTRSGSIPATTLNVLPYLFRSLHDLLSGYRLLGAHGVHQVKQLFAGQFLAQLVRQFEWLILRKLFRQLLVLIIGKRDAGAFGEGHARVCSFIPKLVCKRLKQPTGEACLYICKDGLPFEMYCFVGFVHVPRAACSAFRYDALRSNRH